MLDGRVAYYDKRSLYQKIVETSSRCDDYVLFLLTFAVATLLSSDFSFLSGVLHSTFVFFHFF